MRRSIRTRFTCTFLVVIAAVLLAAVLMNTFGLERFYRKQKLKEIQAAYELLNGIVMEEGGDSRWFNAFRDNQYHRIDWKDGCYITVEGREIALYTKDGRYLLRHSLGDWEALLSENGWFRCHRAFLINPQHIKAVSTMVNSTMSIRMDGAAEEIPVSRSYSNEFRKRMGL